jgi:peptidoglycan/xylan/chitin deacetylase (PgdA/CDA1 family)
VVALTFDDGNDATNVRRILAILSRERVPATFFPTGQAVRRHPDTWRLVADAGFPIGNHSHSHPNLAKLSERGILREIERSKRAIETVTGRMMLPVLRPPGGDYDDAVLRAAAIAGLEAVVLWDVDTRDWTGNSARSVAAKALAGKNGSIILMHTGDNTVKALPRIIAGYQERGYMFVTIGQLLGIDGDVPAFPTPSATASTPGGPIRSPDSD